MDKCVMVEAKDYKEALKKLMRGEGTEVKNTNIRDFEIIYDENDNIIIKDLISGSDTCVDENACGCDECLVDAFKNYLLGDKDEEYDIELNDFETDVLELFDYMGAVSVYFDDDESLLCSDDIELKIVLSENETPNLLDLKAMKNYEICKLLGE